MHRLARNILGLAVAGTLTYMGLVWMYWQKPTVADRSSLPVHVTISNRSVELLWTARSSQGDLHSKPDDVDLLDYKQGNVTNKDEPKNKTDWKEKYLIYVCDSRRSCGGWGDRQRGLVSTFFLANVTNRTFGVIMTKPCELTKYYEPNFVNWAIPKDRLINKSNVSIDDMDSRVGLTRQLSKMDFNREFPLDVIYLRTNADYIHGIKCNELYTKHLPSWASRSVAEVFRFGWNLIMKPSSHLQEHIDEFMRKINSTRASAPFVCAHVRLGRSPTIEMDSAVRGNISELPVLWNFLDSYVKNGSHVFLATDSNEVRNLTRERFGNVMHDTGGRIVHVDKQASFPKACEGFEAALLDQQILTRSDVLVTSKSVFSQRASYLRGKDENLFHFADGKIRKNQIALKLRGKRNMVHSVLEMMNSCTLLLTDDGESAREKGTYRHFVTNLVFLST